MMTLLIIGDVDRKGGREEDVVQVVMGISSQWDECYILSLSSHLSPSLLPSSSFPLINPFSPLVSRVSSSMSILIVLSLSSTREFSRHWHKCRRITLIGAILSRYGHGWTKSPLGGGYGPRKRTWKLFSGTE